ncbi:hypothetical protein BUZ12_13880 [Staphylococcus gallinarum]|nr:hypothetical protein BUZ12_13880 [Staphylococcus gallinarum]
MKERIKLEMYPLTIAQMKFMKLETKIEGSSVNNIPGLLNLGTKFNYEQINKAINKLILNHDNHRIQVSMKNEEYKQYIVKYEEISYPYLDFYQDQLNFDDWLDEKANANLFDFDEKLYEYYILKMPSGDLALFTVQNHLIADGWSMTLLINYFIDYLIGGVNKSVPNCNLSFVHATEEEAQYFQSKKFEKDEIYWRNKLNQQKRQSNSELIHSDHIHCQRSTIKLTAETTKKINNYCMNNDVSVSNLFAGIMLALIDKETVDKIKKIGLLIHNRVNKNEKLTTGNYTKFLPLIIDLNDDLFLSEYITKVKKESFKLLKHRRYPIDKMLSELKINYDILDCLISFQTVNYSSEFIENGFYEKKLEIDTIGIPLVIQIFNKNSESGYLLHYDYQSEVLSAYEIEQLHENILKMLNELVIDTEQQLEENIIL